MCEAEALCDLIIKVVGLPIYIGSFSVLPLKPGHTVLASTKSSMDSTYAKKQDLQSRLGVWIFYLVAGSLAAVLLVSTGDKELMGRTWRDTWLTAQRSNPGWTWCLYTCALSTVTVFITGISGEMLGMYCMWENQTSLFL